MRGMPRRTALDSPRKPRTQAQLNRTLILETAVELADRYGIDAVSMRRIAQQLGVDPMSLYNHVRDKEDLLDGLVDVVVREIEPSPDGSDWKTSMRDTILAARRTLLRHRWAPGVMASRRDAGPATMEYYDAILGILRRGGFSVEIAHHALHVLGSRALGFSQDLFVDSSPDGPPPEMTLAAVRQLAETHPNLGEMAMAVSHEGGLGPCDDDTEFMFALELILDGLDPLRGRVRRRSP
jgi:AcrR family transcriptional regulator